MLRFARALPKLRERVERDLALRGISRERVAGLRGAPPRPRLLPDRQRSVRRGERDLRPRDHAQAPVRFEGGAVVFDYQAKGGSGTSRDRGPTIVRAVKSSAPSAAAAGTGCSPTARAPWRDVRSEEINDYLKSTAGGDFSAKDFRTWNATVLAAVGARGVGARARLSTRARAQAGASEVVKEVAAYLGNTPAVCRASYIDPRVFDCFDGGLTIGGVFERLPEDPAGWPEVQGPIEKAVLDLIDRRE